MELREECKKALKKTIENSDNWIYNHNRTNNYICCYYRNYGRIDILFESNGKRVYDDGGNSYIDGKVTFKFPDPADLDMTFRADTDDDVRRLSHILCSVELSSREAEAIDMLKFAELI